MRDLDRIHKVVDFIACQEGSDRKPILREWAAVNDTGLYLGDGSAGAAACPIIHPNDMAETWTYEAVPRTFLGVWGAGPKWAKRKVVNRVTTTAGVHILSTHMLPSVTRKKPTGRRAAKTWERRRNHYEQHVAAIVNILDRLNGPVVLCGDFNAPPNHPLLEPLRAAGMTQHVNRPTHGTRTIDHQWTRGLVATRAAILSTSSDHHAAALTLKQEQP